MKNINKILISVAAAVLFAGCAKEEFPQSSTVTGDQAATSLMAQVAGLHSWMNKWNVLGSENHWDIGYSALIISREYMGQDYTQRIQYNQWGSWINITGQNKDTTVTQFPWRWYYRLIFTTNSIIAAVEDPANATDPNNKWAVGIAHTYRAMAYLDLGRLYLQGRYTANSSGATVPIVKDGMTLEDTFNNPRVPATELYKFIVEDLETAATLLADYERSEAEVPDASVVDGLLARTYLEMGEWGEAKAHAAAAREGYSPLTKAEWTDKTTGFNNPYSNNSWMWCFSTTKNDDVVTTGICCWVGHVANEADYGYAAYNTVMIDAHLYSLIPRTDFRKVSWLDPAYLEGDSDAIQPISDYPYLDYLLPYASLKFRPGSGEFYNYLVGNSVSVPLMRMEEMMLIEAEAAGRLNLAEGVALLNEFGQSRDTAYSCTASTTVEFVDAVWLQRRIELWGEGFAAFDLKRLNKPVIRAYEGSNHSATSMYNTTEQPDWLNFVIVRTETDPNDGISDEQNNPAPATPQPLEPDNYHVWED